MHVRFVKINEYIFADYLLGKTVLIRGELAKGLDRFNRHFFLIVPFLSLSFRVRLNCMVPISCCLMIIGHGC